MNCQQSNRVFQLLNSNHRMASLGRALASVPRVENGQFVVISMRATNSFQSKSFVSHEFHFRYSYQMCLMEFLFSLLPCTPSSLQFYRHRCGWFFDSIFATLSPISLERKKWVEKMKMVSSRKCFQSNEINYTVNHEPDSTAPYINISFSWHFMNIINSS